MNVNPDGFKESIVDCLKQQLSEFELLKSMYPEDNEITSDAKNINEIEDFVNSKSEYTPGNLDFSLNLLVMPFKLEVNVSLPILYPKEGPNIYIRCNQLNRHQETKLNSQLSEYIKSNYLGEVCVYMAITWLQENINCACAIKDKEKLDVTNEDNNVKEDKFVRLWIYSHHIYNKRKKDDIMKLAKELGLTGFCLPGKPGIICIEGDGRDCKEYWKEIKTMNWQKIGIRKAEEFNLCEQVRVQKFFNFEEIYFHNSSLRHSKHADMSGFSKYIQEHGLTQSFNDFFGLCNDNEP